MPTEERIEKIERVARRRQQATVVLEDVHDPHNAAAVFRSCDAFGIQTVHLVFDQVAPYDPRQIGKVTSSSANKWLDFKIYLGIESCLAELHAEDYTTIATVIEGADETIYDSDFTRPKVAILLGNEHRGLSADAKRLARRRVSIPMDGLIESLNISVSASLFLFEMSRQRRAVGIEQFLFEDRIVRELTDDFLQRKHARVDGLPRC